MGEEESHGQRRERWGYVIGMCPVDGHAGKRSECFVSKGASRTRPEDRQHPLVGVCWVGVR